MIGYQAPTGPDKPRRHHPHRIDPAAESIPPVWHAIRDHGPVTADELTALTGDNHWGVPVALLVTMGAARRIRLRGIDHWVSARHHRWWATSLGATA